MDRESQENSALEERGVTLGSAFQENAARIYAFIYSKVGNREAAEDLTSQVFLKAVRWLADDRSGDSIRSWLYTTARSTIVDYWREQGQHRSVPFADVEGLLFCGTDGPAEVRRTRARALQILAALPKREGDVLRLRFLHGYSATEIGHALGLTPGNVRVLQLRALRRAATAMRQDTGQETMRPGEADTGGAQGGPHDER